MKLLLDTHVFIWMNHAPEKLSAKFREYCERGEEEFFLSIVTPWEIQIKQQLGKLNAATSMKELVEKNQQENGIRLLMVELNHVEMLGHLPMHHRDPFDRLIIAQTIVEKLQIISVDSIFDKYPVDRIW